MSNPYSLALEALASAYDALGYAAGDLTTAALLGREDEQLVNDALVLAGAVDAEARAVQAVIGRLLGS